jgi:hypothetical protein
MTAAQIRTVLHDAFLNLWQNGGLPHETLDNIDDLVESAVEALVKADRDDDLNLAEGPLDVISAALRDCNIEDAGVYVAPDEKAVEIYEDLIDANHLPGVNAQRHSSDSLDSTELMP